MESEISLLMANQTLVSILYVTRMNSNTDEGLYSQLLERSCMIRLYVFVSAHPTVYLD
jgi:hypothetical protein